MATEDKMGEIEALHFFEDAESDDPEMMKRAFISLTTAFLPYITDSPRSHSDAEFAWRMADALRGFMEGCAAVIEMHMPDMPTYPVRASLEDADETYCAGHEGG